MDETLLTILRVLISALGSALVRREVDQYDLARKAADIAEEAKLRGNQSP
jgi:hypothetical protein